MMSRILFELVCRRESLRERGLRASSVELTATTERDFRRTVSAATSSSCLSSFYGVFTSVIDQVVVKSPELLVDNSCRACVGVSGLGAASSSSLRRVPRRVIDARTTPLLFRSLEIGRDITDEQRMLGDK